MHGGAAEAGPTIKMLRDFLFFWSNAPGLEKKKFLWGIKI